MESFIRSTQEEEARAALTALKGKELVRIILPYDPDAMLLAFTLAGIYKRISISWNGGDGDLILGSSSERSISILGESYNIGHSSFSSIVPLSFNLLPVQLSGMQISWLLERREPTPWEFNVLKGSERGGVRLEKGPRLPAYHMLPLQYSILMSMEPFFLGISGNKEASATLVREIGGDDTTYLKDLQESQLSTLLDRLSKASMGRPVVSTRIFINDVDLLELAMAIIYFFDLKGTAVCYKVANYDNYHKELLQRYRRSLSTGFQVSWHKEDSKLIVNTNLRSPLLMKVSIGDLEVSFVELELPDGKYSSRYFNKFQGEGLVKLG